MHLNPILVYSSKINCVPQGILNTDTVQPRTLLKNGQFGADSQSTLRIKLKQSVKPSLSFQASKNTLYSSIMRYYTGILEKITYFGLKLF